jgi:hypothetical protein
MELWEHYVHDESFCGPAQRSLTISSFADRRLLCTSFCMQRKVPMTPAKRETIQRRDLHQSSRVVCRLSAMRQAEDTATVFEMHYSRCTISRPQDTKSRPGVDGRVGAGRSTTRKARTAKMQPSGQIRRRIWHGQTAITTVTGTADQSRQA